MGAPTAEKALSNLIFSMDAYQANQILKKLQDHSVALSFFSGMMNILTLPWLVSLVVLDSLIR